MGRSNRSFRGRRNENRGWPSHGSSYDPTPVDNPNEYTLQQEARDTQRHNGRWRTEGGLRHKNVNFVSAGAFDQSKLIDPTAALANMTLVDVNTESHGNGVPVLHNSCVNYLADMRELMADISHEQPVTFFIDTRGDQSLVKNITQPQIRSPSPTLSVSSEEEILFTGRHSAGGSMSRRLSDRQSMRDLRDPQKYTINARNNERQSLLIVSDAKLEDSHAMREDVGYGRSPSSSETDVESFRGGRDGLSLQQEDLCFVDGYQSSQGKFRARTRRKEKREDMRLMTDDYIANIREQGIDLHAMQDQRDLGGTDSDATGYELCRNGGDQKMLNFRNMSPFNNKRRFLKKIVSKRKEKFETQYLAVWDDAAGMGDESVWLPSSMLNDPRSKRLVEQYEYSVDDKLRIVIDMNNNAATNDDPDDSDDGVDATQQRTDRMTPEAGIDNDDMTGVRSILRPFRMGQRNQGGVRKSKPKFLTNGASVENHETYNEFDVMDFERPSLKKKPKGSRGGFPLEVSDSEHEAAMQASWNNDRIKKRQRKEERQKQRALGLLAPKSAQPNVKNTYLEGMTIDKVAEEIRYFLINENTDLTFPPMDKANRKIVHELALQFNIKSKSDGKGMKRYPVLYRTSRTLPYVEGKFTAVEANLKRRYLPRMDVGGNPHRGFPKRFGRGGFSNTAVSYRDGDIVGASAPELAMDNKGRAMLEKMGWSSGTALGAANNKGILQPLSHVVKNSKAGLG